MEEKDIVASNLTRYRKRAGLSQLELAKKINYSNKNISKWENGETTPNVFILKKIASLYGISVDDFLLEPKETEEVKDKLNLTAKRKKIFRLSMLLLANAILFAVGTAFVYVLGYVETFSFNRWLIYLYLSPLSALSVLIYIRVLYKMVDIVSLSAIGWLVCLAIYLSFINSHNIELIFLVGGAYQLIAIFMALSLNLHLSNKKSNWLKYLARKIKRKKKTEEEKE